MGPVGFVNAFHIAKAKGIVGALRPACALQRLRIVEPALAAAVHKGQDAVHLFFKEASIPCHIWTDYSQRHLAEVLTLIEAVRHANYAAWEGTEVGVRLSIADPALADLDVLAEFKSHYKNYGSETQVLTGASNE